MDAPQPPDPGRPDWQRMVDRAVGEPLAELARFFAEVINPVQQLMTDADPERVVYIGGTPGQIAEAWGRWWETRERIIYGRKQSMTTMLNRGHMLVGDAPELRVILPLEEEWVAQQVELRRYWNRPEKLVQKLHKERLQAARMARAEIARLLSRCELLDYWLEDPFSARLRELLTWYEWACIELCRPEFCPPANGQSQPAGAFVTCRVGRGPRLSDVEFQATVGALRKVGGEFDRERRIWRVPEAAWARVSHLSVTKL